MAHIGAQALRYVAEKILLTAGAPAAAAPAVATWHDLTRLPGGPAD